MVNLQLARPYSQSSGYLFSQSTQQPSIICILRSITEAGRILILITRFVSSYYDWREADLHDGGRKKEACREKLAIKFLSTLKIRIRYRIFENEGNGNFYFVRTVRGPRASSYSSPVNTLLADFRVPYTDGVIRHSAF